MYSNKLNEGVLLDDSSQKKRKKLRKKKHLKEILIK